MQVPILLLLMLGSPDAAGETEGCRATCAAARSEPFTDKFQFKGTNVFCADEMCVIQKKGYKLYQIPMKNMKVKFDVELHKMNRVDMLRNRLFIGIELRMAWTDPILSLCDCRLNNRTQTDQDLQAYVWTPDFLVEESESKYKVGPHDFYLRKGRKSDQGLRLGMAMNLKVVVTCDLFEHYYPFDRNRCIIRVGSHYHSREAVKFVGGDAYGFGDIKYKDLAEEISGLCDKEMIDGKDGFKLFLKRKGTVVKDLYELLLAFSLAVLMLSVLLPVVWEWAGIRDQSGPVTAVMSMSFFILFAIYSRNPPTADLTDSYLLLTSVERGNLLVNLGVLWTVVNLICRRLGQRFDARPFYNITYEELEGENLDKKLDERVRCPACQKVPTSGPLYSCKNDHILCNDCYKGPATNCIVCRARFAAWVEFVQAFMKIAFVFFAYIYIMYNMIFWNGKKEEAFSKFYHNCNDECGKTMCDN